jgi:hypothetical protein
VRARALLLAAAAWVFGGVARAASLPLCDLQTPLSAVQQDRLLAFAAVVKRELEASGQTVALIARSGTNLDRFGLRYSHAGVSLAASANGPWSVRQLYYACDERQPRLYDQGVAGFLFGTDNPSSGYVSIVLLPSAPSEALERVALDTPRALGLLGAAYSANAFAWGTRYQNCNQWVIELLASAWGALDRTSGEAPREHARRWLAREGYAPATVDVKSRWLMLAAAFVPWLHTDDHPEDDVAAMRLRISVPASIEAFVHRRLPEARRIELCHDSRHVVVREGWTSIEPGCVPAPGDRVMRLDSL